MIISLKGKHIDTKAGKSLQKNPVKGSMGLSCSSAPNADLEI